MPEPSTSSENSGEVDGTQFVPADTTAYFNGVAVAIGGGDILITLACNGKSFLTLNTPYVIAKTLSNALVKAISLVEGATGQSVPAIEEFVKTMNVARQNEHQQHS